MTKSKNIRRHTALEIIEALRKLKRATAYTIAAELGMTPKWIQTKIREKRKLFYICDYQRYTRVREVYALRTNNEGDIPKPNKRSKRNDDVRSSILVGPSNLSSTAVYN